MCEKCKRTITVHCELYSPQGVCKILSWQRGGHTGTSLVVQWVRLRATNVGGLGLIPGRGTRSHMHAATKSSHAATKIPVPQLRPRTAKINK